MSVQLLQTELFFALERQTKQWKVMFVFYYYIFASNNWAVNICPGTNSTSWDTVCNWILSVIESFKKEWSTFWKNVWWKYIGIIRLELREKNSYIPLRWLKVAILSISDIYPSIPLSPADSSKVLPLLQTAISIRGHFILRKGVLRLFWTTHPPT